MSPTLRRWRVRFREWDVYETIVAAASEAEACEAAMEWLQRYGRDAFNRIEEGSDGFRVEPLTGRAGR